MEVVTQVTTLHYTILAILGVIISLILVIYYNKQIRGFIVHKKINLKNINKGVDSFNKAVQDSGDFMDTTMNKELSSDIERSNKESEAKEREYEEYREDWGGDKND